MAIKPPSSRQPESQLGLPLHESRGERRFPNSGPDGNPPLKALMDRVWWSRGMKCLEIGCGSGERSEALHHRIRGEHTLGIDTDSARVQQAKALQTRELTFQCLDALIWKPPEALDLILIYWTGGQWEALASLMSRIRPWLAEGGQVLIQCPRPHAHPLARVLDSLARSDRHRLLFGERERPLHRIEPLVLSTHLDGLGFGPQWVDERVFTTSLPTVHRVLRELMTSAFLPLRAEASQTQVELFEEDAKTQILSHTGDQPPFFWNSLHLLVWARLV